MHAVVHMIRNHAIMHVFSHTNHAHNIHVLSHVLVQKSMDICYETYLRNHAKRVLPLTGREGLNKITRKTIIF
jgi:hypothetical protein